MIIPHYLGNSNPQISDIFCTDTISFLSISDPQLVVLAMENLQTQRDLFFRMYASRGRGGTPLIVQLGVGRHLSGLIYLCHGDLWDSKWKMYLNNTLSVHLLWDKSLKANLLPQCQCSWKQSKVRATFWNLQFFGREQQLQLQCSATPAFRVMKQYEDKLNSIDLYLNQTSSYYCLSFYVCMKCMCMSTYVCRWVCISTCCVCVVYLCMSMDMCV